MIYQFIPYSMQKSLKRILERPEELPKSSLVLYSHRKIPVQAHEKLAQKNIDMDQTESQQSLNYLKCIREHNIVEFFKIRMFDQSLMRIICTISFARLKTLDLDANRIESVQIFAVAKFPALERLFLADNNITNIRSLRKLNCPNIKQLQIFSNPIFDYDGLTEMSSKSSINVLVIDPKNGSGKFRAKMSVNGSYLRKKVFLCDLDSTGVGLTFVKYLESRNVQYGTIPLDVKLKTQFYERLMRIEIRKLEYLSKRRIQHSKSNVKDSRFVGSQ